MPNSEHTVPASNNLESTPNNVGVQFQMNPQSGSATPRWNQILNQIEECWPTPRWRDVGVVVGCSGGADSVTLVRALSQLRRSDPPPRGFLVVAHFNHRLRGEESDGDAAFAENLAAELNLTFELQEAGNRSEETRHLQPKEDQDAKAPKNSAAPEDDLDSDEASLRSERMKFLIRIAKQYGARYITLAHSADDNVETMLHHLLRGTGPAGLAGIGHPLAIDQDLVLTRPLIHSQRDVIRESLKEQGHPWREDQSNQDCRYRRNWIRNELIPMMESEFPNARPAMQRAIELQRSWRNQIDSEASAWLAENLADDAMIQVRKDASAPTPILIAAMQQLWANNHWPRQAMNQGHWRRLAEMIQGKLEKPCTLPAGILAAVNGEHIQIQPANPDFRHH